MKRQSRFLEYGGLHSNDGQEEERINPLHLQNFSILNFSFGSQVFLLKLPEVLFSSVGRAGVPCKEALTLMLRVTPPLTPPVCCHTVLSMQRKMPPGIHIQRSLTDNKGNRDLQRNESPDQTLGGIVHRLGNTDDKGAADPSSCNQK